MALKRNFVSEADALFNQQPDPGAQVRVRYGRLRLGISATPAGLIAIGALVSGILLATTLLVRSTVLVGSERTDQATPDL